jgi:hypothetical protein
MLNRKDAPLAEAAEIIRKQGVQIARLQDAKRRAMAIADERSKENAVLRAELESVARYAQAPMKKV